MRCPVVKVGQSLLSDDAVNLDLCMTLNMIWVVHEIDKYDNRRARLVERQMVQRCLCPCKY